jgi:DNA ligase-associated metallophosphoesterase
MSVDAFAPETRMAEAVIGFRGQRLVPLVSGALHWVEENALLVADLHLDKFGAFARRGSLLPPYDTAMTLKKLEADLMATDAREIIALGDSFHRDESHEHLIDADRLRLMALIGAAHWTWISGNHDRLGHGLGGTCVPGLERGGLTLVHEPKRNGGGLVAGHLHPAAQIAINGRVTRRRCFVHDGETLVLPAYGAGTGAMNILSPALAPFFSWDRLEVFMIGRDRVYPVSPKRLVRMGD